MSATIIRFPSPTRPQGPRPKSGRFSARMVYRDRGAGDAPLSESAVAARVSVERDDPRTPMGVDYSVRLAKGEIARVRLEQRGPCHWWIDWVFVPPAQRGRGVAAILMGRVLADADAAGVTLSLEPRACAGPAQAKLEAWYAALGFQPTGRKGELAQIWRREAQASGQTRARFAA